MAPDSQVQTFIINFDSKSTTLVLNFSFYLAASNTEASLREARGKTEVCPCGPHN